MTSGQPNSPRQVQNGARQRPVHFGIAVGWLIGTGLTILSVTDKNYYRGSLSFFIPFMALGGVFFLLIFLGSTVGRRVSETRLRLRLDHPVQIEARIIESRLVWYISRRVRGSPSSNIYFVPVWSLKYEFEFDHVAYQSIYFHIYGYDDLMYGSVEDVKGMIARFPAGSTVPGYFRSASPTLSGLSLLALPFERPRRDYSEQERQQHDLLP